MHLSVPDLKTRVRCIDTHVHGAESYVSQAQGSSPSNKNFEPKTSSSSHGMQVLSPGDQAATHGTHAVTHSLHPANPHIRIVATYRYETVLHYIRTACDNKTYAHEDNEESARSFVSETPLSCVVIDDRRENVHDSIRTTRLVLIVVVGFEIDSRGSEKLRD